MTVTLADIEAAQARLAPVVRDLPLAGARWLDALVGGRVALVTENLQRSGSFKIRGAYNRIALLDESERSRGVVAASAGNHAQGVALAALTLGVQATIFMPEGATIPKVQATRGYGATVHLVGATIEDAIDAAYAFHHRTGAVVVHPFDHPDVVAGQGTIGLDIVRQLPDVRTVIAGVGGGGLLAGLTVAFGELRPDVHVIGVQAEDAAAYPPSLSAGAPTRLSRVATMADGIAVGLPGDVPFSIIKEYGAEIRTVSEDSISRAVLMLLERAKLLVEPAGAAATAAIMENPVGIEPPVAVVLSGGNVDSLVLSRIIRHGLLAAGRFMTVTVRVADRPGTLARLLDDFSRLNTNLLEVEHHRHDPGLGVDEVDIVVQAETRGIEHRQEVLDALIAKGYLVTAH